MRLLALLFALLLVIGVAHSAPGDYTTTGNIKAGSIELSRTEAISASGPGQTASITNVYAKNVSASSLSGMGTGLTVSPSFAGLGLTLDQLYSREPVDVRHFGVIVDGQAHAQNLPGGQQALFLARTFPGVRVDLCPAVYDGSGQLVWTVYGTNTTVDAEMPLRYISHTAIMPSGGCQHNINSTHLFLLEGYYPELTDTAAFKQHHDVQIIGGRWDTVSRTSVSAQSRKMIGATNMGPNSMVAYATISTTSNMGSFGLQTRNGGDVRMLYNVVKMMPRFPHASGGDACHKHANSDGEQWIGNVCWGDDDGCSETIEGTGMNNMTQRNGLWALNDCRSYNNSGMKHSVGESNTSNGRILNSHWDSNFFGTWGNSGNANAWKAQQDDTNGSYSDGLLMTNNVVDCTECEQNEGSGAGPNGTLIAEQMCGLRNVTIKGQQVVGWTYRGVEVTANVCNWLYDGGKVTGYQEVLVQAPAVATISYSTADTLRIDLSPSTAISTSYISASTNYYVSVTAGASLERYLVTQVSSGFVLAQAMGVTSTLNVGDASASLVFRPGSFFNHRPSVNGVVKNVEIYDPPQFTNLNVQSGVAPLGSIYEYNRVYNFRDSIAYNVTASVMGRFLGNQCLDSTGNRCINESSSANNVSNTFIGNVDTGISTTRQSFSLSDPNFKEKYDNVGTNSDWYTFRAFPRLAASNTLATSATVETSLTVGNISATGLTSPSRFIDLTARSLTAGGSITAGSFVGNGASLTGVVASAAPGGSTGQLQYNDNGATAGAAALSYNSGTSVLTAAGVSASAVSASSIGHAGSGDLCITWDTNDTLCYNKSSNRLEFRTGGTERARLGTNTGFNGNMFIGASAATTAQVRLQVDGEVMVSNSAVACASNIRGAMRWSAPSDTIQVCTSLGWRGVSLTEATP